MILHLIQHSKLTRPIVSLIFENPSLNKIVFLAEGLEFLKGLSHDQPHLILNHNCYVVKNEWNAFNSKPLNNNLIKIISWAEMLELCLQTSSVISW